VLDIACIDPHQTGFVGEGSDHLQLIKFWLSRALGKVCGGRKFLAVPYYSQRAEFASLPIERFCHTICYGLTQSQIFHVSIPFTPIDMQNI